MAKTKQKKKLVVRTYRDATVKAVADTGITVNVDLGFGVRSDVKLLLFRLHETSVSELVHELKEACARQIFDVGMEVVAVEVYGKPETNAYVKGDILLRRTEEDGEEEFSLSEWLVRNNYAAYRKELIDEFEIVAG